MLLTSEQKQKCPGLVYSIQIDTPNAHTNMLFNRITDKYRRLIFNSEAQTLGAI